MDARPAYLAEVCNGDEALRHEVELLLAPGDQAASFLETPAMPFDDSLVAKSLEGQCIGPYQVSALIGTGGFLIYFRASWSTTTGRSWSTASTVRLTS